MRRHVAQSGYIGILLILLGTAGMIFLFMKMYFTPTNTATEFQPVNSNGVVPSTQYERLRSDINVANDIANQQKIKADELNRAMNSVQ